MEAPTLLNPLRELCFSSPLGDYPHPRWRWAVVLFWVVSGCGQPGPNEGTRGPSSAPPEQPDTDAIPDDTGTPEDTDYGDSGPDPCAEVDWCGGHAHCEPAVAECRCDDGYFGDPIIGCQGVTPYEGWIGSPCSGDASCGYEGGWCMDPYPDGHCTLDCDRTCPDEDGAPVTFCIEPEDASGGHCFSRCDFEIYPLSGGCRHEYVCAPWERNEESWTITDTCVPADWVDYDPCDLDPSNLAGDDSCFLKQVSFGDTELESLAMSILDGTASAADAEDFLDLHYDLSQDFMELDLGLTVHANYTSGHSGSSPMRGIIVHYTTGQTEDSTIGYFVGSDPHASSHFISGSQRNGIVVQIFSHRNRTWHAGSTYNIDRFGFDFANAGYLEEQGSGWVDYYDRDYDLYLPLHGFDAVWVDDGIPGRKSAYGTYDWWQPYTYYQLLSYVLIARALDRTYGLDADAIQRHGDVSDSRIDPGPQFPFTAINELVFTDDDVFEVPWLDAFKIQADWITEHPEAR